MKFNQEMRAIEILKYLITSDDRSGDVGKNINNELKRIRAKIQDENLNPKMLNKLLIETANALLNDAQREKLGL